MSVGTLLFMPSNWHMRSTRGSGRGSAYVTIVVAFITRASDVEPCFHAAGAVVFLSRFGIAARAGNSRAPACGDAQAPQRQHADCPGTGPVHGDAGEAQRRAALYRGRYLHRI